MCNTVLLGNTQVLLPNWNLFRQTVLALCTSVTDHTVEVGDSADKKFDSIRKNSDSI